MARLYANENFPRQASNALRELGHDVVTALEAGNADKAISDEDVLAFATRNNRAVITLNRRDFIRLHAESQIMLELLFALRILIPKNKPSAFMRQFWSMSR